MYKGTSKEFNNLIEQNGGRTFKIRLAAPSFSIETGIKKVTFNAGSSSDESITVGSAMSAYIEVTVEKIPHIVTGQSISFDLGLEVNGDIEYMPMGIFKANKPEMTDYEITFKAYDRMTQAEKNYVSDLKYPTDTVKVMQEIEKKLGIKFITDISPITLNNPSTEEGSSNIVFAGYTTREAIGYIAGLYGKFAVFNRLGQLEFRWYEDSGFEVPVSKCYSFVKNENNYTVNKIIGTAVDNTQYEAGSGITGISFSNPFVTQEIVNRIHTDIGGFTYRGGETRFLGDCRIDVWDIVTGTDLFGNTYKLPVMEIVHEIDGGLTTTVKSKVSDSENVEDTFKGPVVKAMERTHAQLLVVNNLIASKASIEYLEANYIKTDELDAVEANIENAVITNLQGKFASIEYLEANYAAIDFANVQKASIGTMLADVGLISSATIVDGHVTGFLDAVKVNASNITAGVLDAGNIEVVNLKAASITVGQINGYQIAPGAIDMNNLAESITNEINSASSNAQTALDEALKAFNESQAAALAAGTAQATANGKNTVYYQASAPTTAKKNDIWFNTSKDNQMSIYNGSKWVAEQFGAGAIADNTITAAQIATEVNTKIDNAFNNANAANTIANSALTTADGKNTVFYQTAAPSGGKYKVNDTWFDTDDGNKMYYWNGSAWVAKQFGTNAIANASITNALIANATIQSAKIASLDAAKITTGTLNAARIGSKSITADKLVSKTITAASGVIADAAILTANISDLAVTGAKLANATIGTAKIADAAITSAKIANLDAGKITTGTLNADRIGANTITTIKIAVGDFINYASWKDKTAATSPFTKRNSPWSIDTTVYRTSKASYKFVGTAEASMTEIVIPVNIGEEIYAEFWYKTDSGWTCNTGNSKLRFGSSSGGLLTQFAVSATAQTSWTKVSGTYKVTTSAGPYISVSFNMSGTAAGKSIWIDDITIKKRTTGELIVDGAITAAKLSANAVTADKINAGAITTAKIATGAITSGTIASGSITTDKLAANAVTAAKIASRTITADRIVSGTITANEIAASAITTDKLAANSITAAKIASGAITADKIAAGAVTAAKISVTDLKALGAKIAGFEITDTYIRATDDTVGMGRTADWAFWAGGGTVETAKFRVKNAGDVYMSSAIITGGSVSISAKNETAKITIKSTTNSAIYTSISPMYTWLYHNSNSYMRLSGYSGGSITMTNGGTQTININAVTGITANSISSTGSITGTNCTFNGQTNIKGGIEIFHATPYIDFHYNNSTADNTGRIINTSNGVLTVYNTITNASDRRLKKNIEKLDDKYISVLEKLNPVKYRFIKGDETLNLGFIAQDVEKALIESGIKDMPLITKGADEIYALDYNGIIPLLVLGYQKQKEQLNKQESKINYLENMITHLIGIAMNPARVETYQN